MAPLPKMKTGLSIWPPGVRCESALNQIYLQRHLPWPGVWSGLIPRHNPLCHVGLEVSRTTIRGPIWDQKDTVKTVNKQRVPAGMLVPKGWCLEVCFCLCFLTQVEELVLRLSSGRERVGSCRRGRLAQKQQQRQTDERWRSGRGHRLTDWPASMHPALFIPAHADLRTQVHIQNTHNSTPPGTMRVHNKGRALDCSPVAAGFHCCW